jgi:glycine/serine hydroxymethyltransferase
MKEEAMMEIADLITEALAARGNTKVLEQIRGEVRHMTLQYPLPG